MSRLSEAGRARIADALEHAELSRDPIPDYGPEGAALGWDDAYAIQDALRAARERRGERMRGFKVALTSERKLRELGLDAPLCGYLRPSGAVPGSGSIRMDELIAPRIEPEIAFVMEKAVSGPDCSIDEVLAATRFVAGAFEIIDSRYRKGRFHPPSAVADNVSAARHVVGVEMRRPQEVDLPQVTVVASKNGAVVASGDGTAVFGHPAASVAALAAVLARRGQHIPPGALVLTGGLTDAFAVAAGDRIVARFSGLGDLSVSFS